MKMTPWLFQEVLRSLSKAFADNPGERMRAAEHLLGPRDGRGAGRPGSGMLHGRDNVAKTVTYRAVRNLDFNTERNARRAQRAAAKLKEADHAEWMAFEGL